MSSATKVGEDFNAGLPVPTVTAADMKQMWNAARRINAEMPPRPNVAVASNVYEQMGVTAASNPERFMPVMLRHTLLSALVSRGVLRAYVHGEELDEKAFLAAATMPCGKDDIAEAMIQLQLTEVPAEVAARSRDEMRAQGYDPDKPQIDSKFLGWLRDKC